MDNINHMPIRTSPERAVKLDQITHKDRNYLEISIVDIWYKKMHPNDAVNNGLATVAFFEWTCADINDPNSIDNPNSPAAKFSDYLTSGGYRTLKTYIEKGSIDLNDKDAVLELFNSMFADTIFPSDQSDGHN